MTMIYRFLAVMALTACSGLDVVKNDAVRSFGEVLKILPAENSKGDSTEWVIAAPDSTAWFYWKNQEIRMVVKLNEMEDLLVYSSPQSEAPLRDAPLKLLEKNADFFRTSLGYHAEMDHYNFTIENGNAFEWAKDLEKNQLDIVFALNPEPLIAAGLDPKKLNGWTYTQVPPNNEWKILKSFNLK